MPCYRIRLEYDGTDFHGWQVQPGQRTVQAALVHALAEVTGETVRVVGAGRTDAGVHALGQVASFDVERAFLPQRLQRALNARLPPDVYVHDVQPAPDGFSARASARWRRYRFQMLRRPSPLGRRFHHVLGVPVDADRMAAAAAAFAGTHDFAAFARLPLVSGSICTVYAVRVVATPEQVVFEITANRFLHNMVRRLAGVLVEVGRGRLPPLSAGEILRARDPHRGGPCLPPQGLLLLAVGYDGDEPLDPGAGVDGVPGTPVA